MTTETPTMELRFERRVVRRRDKEVERFFLQQRWSVYDSETVVGFNPVPDRQEWRDVPVVEAE